MYNLPATWYLSFRHQRGVLDSVNFLATRIEPRDSILFLMPCHSTPFYRYLNIQIFWTILFINCKYVYLSIAVIFTWILQWNFSPVRPIFQTRNTTWTKRTFSTIIPLNGYWPTLPLTRQTTWCSLTSSLDAFQITWYRTTTESSATFLTVMWIRVGLENEFSFSFKGHTDRIEY